MLTQYTRRVRVGRFLVYTLFVANIGALAFVSACDKVPLMAPTGSVITLIATSDFVPANGETEIIATVIENGAASGTPTTPTPTPTPSPTPTPGQPTPPTTPTTPTTTTRSGAGTPVQNGTVVSFTTTIGRIEPSEARTHNGQVRVRLIAGGQSGLATITAFSGGAVGTLQNLRIGAAAAGRVLVTMSPQSLCGTGGTVQVNARVETAAGVPLSGVPVTFSTDQGTLSSTSAVTDASGIATVALTTARTATVVVNAAGQTEAKASVTVNARTGVTITAPTTQVSAGVPATFTVGVAGGGGTGGTGGSAPVIRDVTVDFGDGSRISLGPITGTSVPVQHTYLESGTYTVRAIAEDAVCGTEAVATAITILPGQPPAVTITASNSNPTVGETVTFTATVSGATSTILRYEWNFGAGAFPQTIETTSNRATTTYTTPGTKIITVRVIQAAGPAGDNTTGIVVRGTGG